MPITGVDENNGHRERDAQQQEIQMDDRERFRGQLNGKK